jgi:hypothetical protein
MPQPSRPISYASKTTPAKLETDNRLKLKKDSALVNELKAQWKLMWRERFNDKVKAEDVSVTNYAALNVERGTVIHASRDFKALNFREILEKHRVENPDRFIPPDTGVGGWNRFIKTKITNSKSFREKRTAAYVPVKPVGQQPKKGGRGWLHRV